MKLMSLMRIFFINKDIILDWDHIYIIFYLYLHHISKSVIINIWKRKERRRKKNEYPLMPYQPAVPKILKGTIILFPSFLSVDAFWSDEVVLSTLKFIFKVSINRFLTVKKQWMKIERIIGWKREGVIFSGFKIKI